MAWKRCPAPRLKEARLVTATEDNTLRAAIEAAKSAGHSAVAPHLIEAARVALVDAVSERTRYFYDVHLLTECPTLGDASAPVADDSGDWFVHRPPSERVRTICDSLKDRLRARGWRVSFPGGTGGDGEGSRPPSRPPSRGAPDGGGIGFGMGGEVGGGVRRTRRGKHHNTSLESSRRESIDQSRIIVICITREL